jgi:hypothetical protein
MSLFRRRNCLRRPHDKVVVCRRQPTGKWTLNLKDQIVGSLDPHLIAQICKNDQAVQQVIAVVATTGDVKKEIYFRRSKNGVRRNNEFLLLR